MIYFRLNGVGDEIAYDDDSLTYPEGLELEKQTGMGANKFLAEVSTGTTQSTAAILWIAAVRADAAEHGQSFRDAAKARPFARFTEGLDLMASMKSSRRAVEPPLDPTGPTPDGSPDSTSPATSAPQPEASPSPSAAATTSGSSPTSSPSAPGSGTS
jgi:hypothetical protein